jgi:photosystem II stability/assembly factor-like uncharacterized protein
VGLLLLLLLAALGAEVRAEVDPSYLAGMKYRNVGPHRGGRATTGTGVPGEPHTFYFGSTGGGVWRTEDAGESWHNLTDGQIGAGGIGAVAVAFSDPNVIYAGTGSTCIRGNVSPGIGAYRSTDAGKSWSFIGLEKAGQIGKIVVHPKDADLVYAAALGNAFGPNEERGIYRSKNGGATWERVLYVDDRSGAPDLSMDALNPRVLYAGVWGGAERKPWDLRSGSEGGGVYKSTDGGDSWNKLGGGLPEGLVGKVGVAVSPADSNRVYALIEHEKGGLYRSDDAGASWKMINGDHMLWERPWYYMHVTPDPQNADKLWVSNVIMQRSVDGGKSFQPIMTPHPDNHGVWINPDNTDLMINVNDGGANVSLNGGKSWSTQRNQATAELYRVAVDDQFPYRLYAGQQDNSSISVPSRLPPGMASNFEAEFQVGGCESAHVAVDPRDPDVIYATCYGGSLTRLDRKTGLTREILAYPQLQLAQDRGELEYRFQWNAPVRISPHDPATLYHTSQFVHRSRDEGDSWEIVSPDLSTDNPDHQGYAGGPITRDGTGVEVYGSIFAFEESPLTAGVLWAGSDDGLVHVSRDDGANWTNVTPPDLPEGATVNSIDLSRHQDGRAFVAAYRYREADNRPYVFATDDFGASWRSLADGANGIPANHFVRVVREDPDRRGLLYAGTEFGMYVSFDDGAGWQSLQGNLPVTPVTDIQVHKGDLVLATQGRSFWILDDLTPLHVLSDEVMGASAWLSQPRPSYRLNGSGGFALAGGRRATDAPKGAVIDYFLGESVEGPVEIEIKGPDGETVRTFSSTPPPPPPVPLPEALIELARAFGLEFGGRPLTKSPGHNRYVWDLGLEAPKLPPGAVIFGFLQGAAVVPGDYEITLTAGDVTQSRTLEVRPDPRGSADQEEMQAQLDFLREVEGRLEVLGTKVTALRSARKQAQAASDRVAQVSGAAPGDGDEEAEGASVADVEEAAKALAEKLTAIEQELLQTKSRSFEDPLNYPGRITAHIAYLHTVVNSGSDAAPTEGSRRRLANLDSQLEDVYGRLDEILSTDVAAFNELVSGMELPAIVMAPAGD